jgi:hypothetical protein
MTIKAYFGKRITKTILTHGSGTFIAERFLFEYVKEDCDELKVVIPSDLEHSYFNRININVTSFTSCYHWGIFKLYSICIFFSGAFTIIGVINNKSSINTILASACGMCNKLDKDGNHQDMLMDQPESDRYACSFDSDSESISRSEYSINRRFIIYYTDNCYKH